MDSPMISQRFPPLGDPQHDELDGEDRLRARALDGDVEALLRWRQMLDPIDYDELGWGD